MDKTTVLIVEDEAIVALDLKFQLEGQGYAVVGIADSAEVAIGLARRHRPRLTLMDVMLQGPVDGIEAARLLQREFDLPVIFLTSFSDADTVRRAAEAGPYGYLTKPFQITELRAGIEVALAKAEMERQLRESERWYASTLRCIQDGVLVVSDEQRIRFLNPAAEDITGWSMTEAAGRPVQEVVKILPEDVDAPLPLSGDHATAPRLLAVSTAMAEGGRVGMHHARVLEAKDGSRRQVDESTGPVHDEAGRPLGAVLVLRDANERLQREAQLLAVQQAAAEQLAELANFKVRQEAAELSERQRSEFMARVSHEMRTPLNAVIGFAELLVTQAAPGAPQAAAYSQQILTAGNHLLALVDDLLGLRRIDANALNINLTDLSLAEAVHEAVCLLGPLAASNSVRCHVDVPAGMRVRADPLRLRQILLNLGSNAVKYNHRGGEVSFAAEPVSLPSGAAVALAVRDDGIGIGAEQLERLFEPFNRLGRETSNVPGVGLGLVITRKLIEQMGGSMTVTSQHEQGTEVRFLLPAASA